MREGHCPSPTMGLYDKYQLVMLLLIDGTVSFCKKPTQEPENTEDDYHGEYNISCQRERASVAAVTASDAYQLRRLFAGTLPGFKGYLLVLMAQGSDGCGSKGEAAIAMILRRAARHTGSGDLFGSIMMNVLICVVQRDF